MGIVGIESRHSADIKVLMNINTPSTIRYHTAFLYIFIRFSIRQTVADNASTIQQTYRMVPYGRFYICETHTKVIRGFENLSEVDTGKLGCETCYWRRNCFPENKAANWMTLIRKGLTRCFIYRPYEPEVEGFAVTHGISFDQALHSLLFIGAKTTQLAERGLDVADYQEDVCSN